MNFYTSDETYDYLSTGEGDDSEQVGEPIKWVAFKQRFFTSGIIGLVFIVLFLYVFFAAYSSFTFSNASYLDRRDAPAYIRISLLHPTNFISIKILFAEMMLCTTYK